MVAEANTINYVAVALLGVLLDEEVLDLIVYTHEAVWRTNFGVGLRASLDTPLGKKVWQDELLLLDIDGTLAWLLVQH